MGSVGVERVSPQSDLLDAVALTSSKMQPNIVELKHAQSQQPIQAKGWHERAISQLNDFDCKLEELIPNFSLQTRIDALGQSIEKMFAPLVKFNNWLNSNGHGSWYRQLAAYLVTLPAYAVRNILQQVYTIIRGITYGTVHPLKGANNLAKMLVTLVHELTKPETWAKMGAGTIGTSLGQAAIGGNLLSLVGLGIGGAMVVGGVSLGALKAAFYAEKDKRMEAVGQHLLRQAQELSEAAVTGFAMGLIIGGIQRAFRKGQPNVVEKEKREHKLSNLEEGKVSKALTASHSSSLTKLFPKTLYTDDVIIGSGPNGGMQYAAFFDKIGKLKKNIELLTVYVDPTGAIKNNTQLIYYGKEVISTTNEWFFEHINGEGYVAWVHKDFLVYTGDFNAIIVKR